MPDTPAFKVNDRVHHSAGDGTVEAITPSPFHPSDRFYDNVCVRLDDGQIAMTSWSQLRPIPSKEV